MNRSLGGGQVAQRIEAIEVNCDSSRDITALLQKAVGGEEEVRSRLFRMVEEELRKIAEAQIRGERSGHSLQPTMLVHDAFMRLVGANSLPWDTRKHFYRAAARAMRRILIDYERQRRAQKRGGDGRQVLLDLAGVETVACSLEDLLALDEALDKLAKLDPRQVEVVQLRHFGGYSIEETADILDVSPATVKLEFAAAKTWLYRELTRGAAHH